MVKFTTCKRIIRGCARRGGPQRDTPVSVVPNPKESWLTPRRLKKGSLLANSGGGGARVFVGCNFFLPTFTTNLSDFCGDKLLFSYSSCKPPPPQSNGASPMSVSNYAVII